MPQSPGTSNTPSAPRSPGPLRIAALGLSLCLLIAYVAYKSGVAVSPEPEATYPHVMPGSKSAPAVDEIMVMPGSKSGGVTIDGPGVDLQSSQQNQRVVLPGSKSDRIIIEDPTPTPADPPQQPTPAPPSKPQVLPGSKSVIISE